MDLNDLKTAVVFLGLITLVGAAAAIGMSSFQENLDSEQVCYGKGTNMTYNLTRAGAATPCCNSTAGVSQNCESSTYTAYNITNDGLSGVDNGTDFLDTIGTIMGVAVLITLVILAFSFARK